MDTIIISDRAHVEQFFTKELRRVFSQLISELDENPREAKDWLSGPDVLHLLGISRPTLARWRDSGHLEFCKVGRKILYERSALNSFLRSNSRVGVEANSPSRTARAK